MPTLTMPQLGESVTEGTVIRWLKQPNDRVALDDPLVEIDTEKVNVEIPSPFAGTLSRIMVEEGQTVPIGTPLAEIQGTGATAAEPPTAAGTPSAPSQAPLAQAVQPQTGTRRGTGAQKLSPIVARLATQHNIDPATLRGTGAGGRITKKDMRAAIEAQAVPSLEASSAVADAPTPFTEQLTEDRAVPETPMRRAIADHMIRSRRAAAHAWLVMETDVTSLVAARTARKDEFRQREDVALTYLAFIAHAVARALHQFPRLNATWQDGQLFERGDINLGFAVDVPDGLVVPVVHQADRMSIAECAHAIADVAARARSGGLKLHEIQGGTFTIDNTGAFGTTMSAPIIHQPQVAILTTEAIIKRAVVIQSADGAAGGTDALAIRAMMNLCLSFDHRALDGALAARFTARVKEIIEAIDPDAPIH